MAMSSVLLSRAARGDGNIEEVWSCYADAATGTLQLPTGVDLRNIGINATDSSTAGTVIGKALNISTGVLTLSGMVSTALTGVSGGSAGGQTFTGTGGVVGAALTGSANFAANTMIIGVAGTTITVDKPLLGAIAAGTIVTHAVVEITYAQ